LEFGVRGIFGIFGVMLEVFVWCLAVGLVFVLPGWIVVRQRRWAREMLAVQQIFLGILVSFLWAIVVGYFLGRVELRNP